MGDVRRVLPLQVRPAEGEGGLELVEEHMRKRAAQAPRGSSLRGPVRFVSAIGAAVLTFVGAAKADTLHLVTGRSVDNVEVSQPVGGVRTVNVPGSSGLPIAVSEASIRGVDSKVVSASPSGRAANEKWVEAVDKVREAEGLPPLSEEVVRQELQARGQPRQEAATLGQPLQESPRVGDRVEGASEPVFGGKGPVAKDFSDGTKVKDVGGFSPDKDVALAKKPLDWVPSGTNALYGLAAVALISVGVWVGRRWHGAEVAYHDMAAGFHHRVTRNMGAVVGHADRLNELGHSKMAKPWYDIAVAEYRLKGDLERLDEIGRKLIEMRHDDEGGKILTVANASGGRSHRK